MTTPATNPAPPQRRWWVGPAAIFFCLAVSLGVRWLIAAPEGEKCGGATGCQSGLVCVQLGVEVVSNVVEHRRCRKRCDADADCAAPRRCTPIGRSKTRACLGPADLR